MVARKRPGKAYRLSARWSPNDTAGYTHLPPPLVTLIVIIAVTSVTGLLVLGSRQRSLTAELAELSRSVEQAEHRERELEATVARRHQSLQDAEGELEMLRLQMDSVELQLDGVDYLSREVRAELGLPAGKATWANDPGAEEPQGGSGAPLGTDRERFFRAQMRLSAGIEELQRLLQRARAHRAEAELGIASPVEPLVQDESGPPANWPARGPVSSAYGWREFAGRTHFHTGIDIALAYGTVVQATGAGIVVGSGWQPGYGWSVLIHHPMGYSTLFAHLAETIVEVGDEVTLGDPVGFSGSSGRSTGPHLHYEIWKDGRPLDPRPLMDGNSVP
jgi:murein DD-endopeptidase MepM/ murein hydrolase activator NlpD